MAATWRLQINPSDAPINKETKAMLGTKGTKSVDIYMAIHIIIIMIMILMIHTYALDVS